MTNAKKCNKYITSMILVAILLSSAYIGIGTVSAFKSGATSVTGSDYVTFEGTAANDSYSSMQYSYKVNEWLNTIGPNITSSGQSVPMQYSYNPSNVNFNANKSLRISMTEFGEFASLGTNGDTAGIAYGANSAEWANSESWATDVAVVSPDLWIQGWTFYMNYSRGLVTSPLHAVEAWATYSNSSSAEMGRAVYGWDGTKYATAVVPSAFVKGSLGTSGVEVLYDSARLVVGRTTITIMDSYYIQNEPVAQITFTVIFQKDTKYAIVYKDIKILLPPKDLAQINDFAFSERYELDIAAKLYPSLNSYVHYYASNLTSVYQHPLTGSNKVDILQAYNQAHTYTYFAAYWPNATEYSVQAPMVPNLVSASPGLPDTSILPPNTAVADLVNPAEPKLPQVVVQWRYNSTTGQWPNMLNFLASGDKLGGTAAEAVREFRVVEIVGMTDYNALTASYRAQDAQDPTANKNQISGEVYYLLSQVFNPEDLTTALTGSLSSYIGAPAQWVSVGQTSAATDSAGASMMSAIYSSSVYAPLALFDTNNSLPSNVLQVGTIPYGLATNGTTSNYVSTVSNSLGGTGTDATLYQRLGLTGFVFGYYDAASAARSPAQPIAGGYSLSGTGYTSYWYPSKDPLTERWTTATWAMVGYYGVTWNPNGIVNVGGEKANALSRYFNDFNFAIDREGTAGVYYTLANGGVQTGLPTPTSSITSPTLDFFPLSTWNTSTPTGPITTFGYTNGYAIISVARDINGTRGITVAGWDARDTYWASAWASQYLKAGNTGWVPPGTVAIILNIAYSSVNNEPTGFTVVKDLGTITEFGANIFSSQYGFDAITGIGVAGNTWTAPSDLSTLPTLPAGTNPWWYQKLPTTSIAKINFDP